MLHKHWKKPHKIAFDKLLFYTILIQIFKKYLPSNNKCPLDCSELTLSSNNQSWGTNTSRMENLKMRLSKTKPFYGFPLKSNIMTNVNIKKYFEEKDEEE